MCTIIAKNHFIGKNFDSVVNTGMIFTNKRGLIKTAAIFPPEIPLEWVSLYGSITFSQSGKEYPVCGMNECGLVVEQATLKSTVYPDQDGNPAASSLEMTQFLLDTCSNIGQALDALARAVIVTTSWPVHFALFDREGNRVIVEFLKGEKKIYQEKSSESIVMDNTEYLQRNCLLELRTVGEVFETLDELRARDTIWSAVYDLNGMKIHIRSGENSEEILIQLDQADFSPQSKNLLLDLKEKELCWSSFNEERNRMLLHDFFYHPVIAEQMKVPEKEPLIDFMVNQSKSYDITNGIVLRFLEGERIKQIPIKETHKRYVLKYLASKFEIGMEYSEGQVNAVIDKWHTFGDYFILRRELIDSGLLKRLPNGSKYWRNQ